MQITGASVPVVEGILQSALSGAAQYSLSATGSLVYVPVGAQANQRSLVWVSRTGAEQPLTAPARPYRAPRLSPDGRRIAVAIEEQETQTWLYDFARDALTRFTLQGSMNYDPVWTPDGKRIAFRSNSQLKLGPEYTNLFWQLADGGGGLEKLSDLHPGPSSWSPDGQVLALETNSAGGRWSIVVLRLSDRSEQPLLQTSFNRRWPWPCSRWTLAGLYLGRIRSL